MTPGDFARNSAATTTAVKAILDRGAVPIVLGGDHAIPIPVFRAYEGRRSRWSSSSSTSTSTGARSATGSPQGLSSTMRRASEMPWVSGMAQIGLRAVGSARQGEVDDSLAYGSVQVRAEEVHADRRRCRAGAHSAVGPLLHHLRCRRPRCADSPRACSAPALAGSPTTRPRTCCAAWPAKGKIVGYDIVEVVPSLDVANMTSQVCARLTLNLIGEMAHQGQIGRRGVGELRSVGAASYSVRERRARPGA